MNALFSTEKNRILEIQDNQKGIYKYLKQTHHLLALTVVSKSLYKYVKLYLSQFQKNRRIVCLWLSCTMLAMLSFRLIITISLPYCTLCKVNKAAMPKWRSTWPQQGVVTDY